MADILTKLEVRSYSKKEEIIRIGDFGDNFYIILDGFCEVQILDQKLESRFKKFENELYTKQIKIDTLQVERQRIATRPVSVSTEELLDKIDKEIV